MDSISLPQWGKVAAEPTDEEGKVMPHNSLFAQTINVKKEQ